MSIPWCFTSGTIHSNSDLMFNVFVHPFPVESSFKFFSGKFLQLRNGHPLGRHVHGTKHQILALGGLLSEVDTHLSFSYLQDLCGIISC